MSEELSREDSSAPFPECEENLTPLQNTLEDSAKENIALDRSLPWSRRKHFAPSLESKNEGSSEIKEINDHSLDTSACKMEEQVAEPISPLQERANNRQLLRECDELRKRNADQSRAIFQLQKQVSELNEYIHKIRGEQTHLESIIHNLQHGAFAAEARHGNPINLQQVLEPESHLKDPAVNKLQPCARKDLCLPFRQCQISIQCKLNIASSMG